jgi:hypothetical protein
MQHSLLWDFGASFSAATSVACGAGVVATLVGSDLAEPPQHGADMIDLQFFDFFCH